MASTSTDSPTTGNHLQHSPTSPPSTPLSPINLLNHHLAPVYFNIREGFQIACQSVQQLAYQSVQQLFRTPTTSAAASHPTPKQEQPPPLSPSSPIPSNLTQTPSTPFRSVPSTHFGPTSSIPNPHHSLASILQPSPTSSSAFPYVSSAQVAPFENHSPFSYNRPPPLRRRNSQSHTVPRPTRPAPPAQTTQNMDVTWAHATPQSAPRKVYERSSFTPAKQTPVVDLRPRDGTPVVRDIERRGYSMFAIPAANHRTVTKNGSTAQGKVTKPVRKRLNLLTGLVDRHMTKSSNRRSSVIVLESQKKVQAAAKIELREDNTAVLEENSGMRMEELQDFLPPEVLDLLQERPDLLEKITKQFKLPTDPNMSGMAEARRRAAKRKKEMLKREQDRAQYEAKNTVWRMRGATAGTESEEMEEEAPEGASHYDQVFWSEDGMDMDDWEEYNDGFAMEEKREKRTVVDEESMFSPLTASALKRLRRVMSTNSMSLQPLANVSGCIITGADLAKLKPGQWLNDEIVNAYFELLMSRANEQRAGKEQGDGKKNGKRKNGKKKVQIPSVRIVSSFFYSQLVKFNPAKRCSAYDYTRVRRWTRRFDVFAHDLLLIPINQQNTHWTLGVVNFRDKTVMHFDSMGNGGSARVRQNLLAWVRDEAADKKKGRFVESEWSMVPRPDVPRQQNSDDCGVFICKFADSLTRGWNRFTFDQRHMDYFRSRIAHELLMGKAS